MASTLKNQLIPDRGSIRVKSRKGALTVELALTIGLAFFFFFAAFEFCRVAMIRHTVDNAIYEGARAGIIPGATATDVEREATRILRSLNLTNVDIDVTPRVLTNSTRDVTVQIQVPLDRNLYGPAKFFRGMSIESQLTMRREHN